jgi:hypothetical protein
VPWRPCRRYQCLPQSERIADCRRRVQLSERVSSVRLQTSHYIGLEQGTSACLANLLSFAGSRPRISPSIAYRAAFQPIAIKP